MRALLLEQLSAVTQSVVGLFRMCPIDRLDFRPAPGVRNLLDLGNHFAAVPLVDLAVLQGNPCQVTETIEDSLHGVGPDDWVDIFSRGVRAVAEYFEGMEDAEFTDRVSRAHYGTAHTQAEWLLEVVTHVYHHRGQLYAYLRMMGVLVDVEHLYT